MISKDGNENDDTIKLWKNRNALKRLQFSIS